MRTQILWTSLILGGGGLALAQEGTPSASAGRQPALAEAKPSPDEQAIRAADEAFVQEYNRGATKALVARFAEDAEVVEADGVRYRGRPLIEQRLAETFAASPGVKLQIQAESIQFLSPEVVKEEGQTTVTPAKGAAEMRRHTAILVKRGGLWLISSIREEAEPLVPPHERLKDLAWMIGEWVDQGSDAHVRVSCRWSDDGNFLVRTFAVSVAGKPAMTVDERIGWDPLGKQFHSWEFDSEGGYGEGRWSRDGNRWVIKHTGVRPDGVTASATHTMTQERPDLVRWSSTDRVVGGDNVPQGETFVMVHVPPPPQSPALTPPAAPDDPQTDQEPPMIRNPRFVALAAGLMLFLPVREISAYHGFGGGRGGGFGGGGFRRRLRRLWRGGISRRLWRLPRRLWRLRRLSRRVWRPRILRPHSLLQRRTATAVPWAMARAWATEAGESARECPGAGSTTAPARARTRREE